MAIIEGKPTKDKRKYSFKVYYKDLQGNTKQYLSKKYALKSEAKEAERNYLLSLTNKISDNTLTFRDLRYEYDNYKKDKIKITSYTNYNKYYKRLMSLDNIKLNDLNIKHINQWKSTIDVNLSTKYKNELFKFLKSILKYGYSYHEIENINRVLIKVTGFTNPNEIKKEMNFYTFEEFNRFISAVDDIRYKTFFEILYYCGLRRGEANALTWNNIDFENEKIHIKTSISQKVKGNKYVLLPPKTKGSIRTLPMTNIVKRDLIELYKYYNKYENFDINWFVFGGIYPLADTSADLYKNNICKKINLKTIRMHDFRHSCASFLISNGASPTIVSKYLGHDNPATTLKIYTHMFNHDLDNIIKIINKKTKNSI